MKKFLFIILVFSYFSSFCQTVNLNQQAVIRPNRNNFITVLQNGAAKRMNEGELRDTLLSLVNVSISQKATKTALSDTTFQLRSDLATKTAFIDSMKDVIVAFHYRGFSPNTNISLNYEGWKDGWHAIFFHNSNYALSYTANASATMTVTSNVYDPESQTELTMGGGSTIVTDNDIVVVKIVGGIMQTWYRVSTAKRLSVEVENLKTTKLNKSDTVSLSNRIIDGDNLRWLKTDIDTSKLLFINAKTVKTNYTGITIEHQDSTSRPSIVFQNKSFVYDDTKLWQHSISMNTWGIGITSYRRAYSENSNTYNHISSINNTVDRIFLDGNKLGQGKLATKNVKVIVGHLNGNLDSSSFSSSFFGKQVGTMIISNDISGGAGVKAKGYIFLDNISDTLSLKMRLNSPQLESIVVTDLEGNKWVKTSKGWTKTVYENAIKSKSLTLTASTNPTLDFESAVSITYEITTSTANDNLTPVLQNIKDGARVSLAINAPVSTTLNFPSMVKKKDGTNFGAYACTSEVLDFVVIGSNLRCINK